MGKRGTMRGGIAEKSAQPTDRVIMHVDMDAFYAQIEQKLRPELRGKPVIVGASDRQHGVVATCSYEAREFGVRAGMSAREAFELCPHAVPVLRSLETYTYFSAVIHAIFERFTPIVEPASIDEAYLDTTGCSKIHNSPLSLACGLKDAIRREVGITCSVGIATNKHLAKVASALNKPDGLTTLWPYELREKLHPLDVSRLLGVGPVTSKYFHDSGIRTIEQLVNMPDGKLEALLGKTGLYFKRIAEGKDESPVHTLEVLPDEKSMSHERTFNPRNADIDFIHSVILDLSDRVASRLKAGGFLGRTITLKVKYSDFTRITRDRSIPIYTRKVETIYKTAKSLLPQDRPILKTVRLIGVRVSNLVKEDEGSVQPSLFGPGDQCRESRASDAIESVRSKYGRNAILRAGSLKFLDSGRRGRHTIFEPERSSQLHKIRGRDDSYQRDDKRRRDRSHP